MICTVIPPVKGKARPANPLRKSLPQRQVWAGWISAPQTLGVREPLLRPNPNLPNPLVSTLSKSGPATTSGCRELCLIQSAQHLVRHNVEVLPCNQSPPGYVEGKERTTRLADSFHPSSQGTTLMPITATCPGCNATFTLAESFWGKKVRCKKCQEMFLVGAGPRQAPAEVRAEEDRFAEDRDDSEPRDTQPRRRGQPERDEPDEPRRRKGRPERKQGGRSVLLWVFLGVGLFLAGGAGVGLWLLLRGSGSGGGDDTPRQIALNVPSRPIKAILFSDPKNHQAVVYSEDHRPTGMKNIFDRYDLKTGKKLSRNIIPCKFIPGNMVLSPDGTHLAISIIDKINVWSLTEGKEVMTDLNPAMATALQKIIVWKNPALLAFLDNKRLFVVHEGGGRSLWQIPEKKELYSLPAENPDKLRVHHVHPHTFQNDSIALSPDRTLVAVFNHDGYDLFDTATGKLVRKTAGLKPQSEIRFLSGTGFSPDGKQLACFATVFTPPAFEKPTLVRWDVQTGAVLGKSELPPTLRLGTINWVRPRCLLILNHGLDGAHVIDPEQGKVVRKLGLQVPGRLGPNSWDGRLWYANGGDEAFLSALTSAQLEEAGEGEVWTLVPGDVTK
jgi:hypothetical protein